MTNPRLYSIHLILLLSLIFLSFLSYHFFYSSSWVQLGKYPVVTGSSSSNYEKMSFFDVIPSSVFLKNTLGDKLGFSKYHFAAVYIRIKTVVQRLIKFLKVTLTPFIDSVFTIE